jgi:hypothetical protein
MNKYLMLTAAALLSSAATVDAETYCFYFGGYCDGGRVYTGVDGGALNGAVRAWVHTNNNCASGTSQGQGILGKLSVLGKTSIMSDNIEAKNYGIYSEQLSYGLPKKIESWQPWTAWVGLGGTTSFEVNSGLIFEQNCQNPAAHHGRKSTLDVVKAIIAADRNAKARSE